MDKIIKRVALRLNLNEKLVEHVVVTALKSIRNTIEEGQYAVINIPMFGSWYLAEHKVTFFLRKYIKDIRRTKDPTKISRFRELWALRQQIAHRRLTKTRKQKQK